MGVLFRGVSLAGRAAFAGRAAPCLILLATIATMVAAQSGEDAHVAVAALPGVGATIRAHELWGERTRNVAIAVATLELLALVLQRRADAQALRLASAGVGVLAALAVLRTGQLGGELVLPARRRGRDPQRRPGGRRPPSPGRALRTGRRRREGRPRWERGELARHLLEDRHDAAGALEILDRIGPIPDDGRLRFRAGWLAASALEALGRPAEARVRLERLRADFPDDPRLLARLGKDR